MEKYYFLQENKETVNLYFDNTTTNKESFFVAISLYKYLESKVTNPVLLSWMDSTKIVKNYERLDYHVVRSLRVKMDPFSISFSYYGDNEGEGTYGISICSGEETEIGDDYCFLKFEDEEYSEPLQKFYDEHCDAKELSFQELIDFCSFICKKDKWEYKYKNVSWDSFSRNKNQQKSARK